MAPEPAGSRHRYVAVLLLLVAGYLVGALSPDEVSVVAGLAVYTSALLIAVRGGGRGRRMERALRWTLPGGSAAMLCLLLFVNAPWARGVAALWLTCVLAVVLGYVVRDVLADRVVTVQTIAGALSAYLLIGLLFAAGFAALAHLGQDPFFAGGAPVNAKTLQYFSFTTLTTLGYGDFAVLTDAGRALAVLQALTGQIFLVTLVARLVSMFGRS